MKRFLLMILFGGVLSGINAQNTFSDDFETYTLGAYLASSSAKWTTWSGAEGGTLDTRISNEQAHSGTKSAKFANTVAAGGTTDIILPFGGRKTDGTFTMEMWMYVVTDAGGYFNFQGNAAVGGVWSLDAFFDPDGTTRFQLGTGGAVNVAVGTHPKETWFDIKIVANLTDNNWEAFIDGKSLGSWSNPNNAVASMDIYPVSSNNVAIYYIDDISYKYEPYVALNLDASLTAATVRAKGLAGTTSPGSIKIKNTGRTRITKAEVEWSVNGGAKKTETYTNLQLDSLVESAALPLSSPVTYLGGTAQLDFAITKVNDAVDDKATNNSRSLTIEGVVPAPHKKIVVEEATGTWCQWCPRGAVYMDSLTKLYPDHFIGIAVHNADPMTVTEYDAGMRGFPGFTGFPSVVTDRRTLGDPSGVEPVFFDQIVELTPVTLDLGAKYDATTREMTVEVKADFLEAVSGDYRFNMIVVESGVKGTTSSYNQSNAYAGGANGVMGGFEVLPNPVPYAKMTYNHVGRAIMDGWSGEAGYLPNDIPAGTSYLKSYTYTLPAGYNYNNIKLVGIMIDPNTEIVNANEVTIDEAIANGLFSVATNNPTHDLNQLIINPNPASDLAQVHIAIANQSKVSMEIMDLMGKVISKKEYGVLSGVVDLPIQTSVLENGNYMVRVIQDNKFQTQKLVVAH